MTTIKAGDAMAIDINGHAVKWHPPCAGPDMFAAGEPDCGDVLVTVPTNDADRVIVDLWRRELQAGK